MGNKQSAFTEQQLDTYQDCTFFTRKQILRVYYRFKELAQENVTNILSNTVRLSHQTIENMPEFRENPFRRRICEAFSNTRDGDMCFDEFLDMFSVFSDAAPRDLKAFFAFRIYDFDGDDYLNRSDLVQTINCLTRSELTDEEVQFIIEKVFEESDLDDDGQITYTEFEHFISRAPDFLSNFHVRI